MTARELVNTDEQPDSLRVSALVEEDLDRYSRLVMEHESFRPYGLTPARLRETLAGLLAAKSPTTKAALSPAGCGSTVLVGEVDGEPAGLVWLVRNGAFLRSGYIRLLLTSAARQGSGVADALMDAAEAELLREGNDVLLLVNASNGRARRFYERRGYVEVGVLDDYVVPGQTECIYRMRPQAQEK